MKSKLNKKSRQKNIPNRTQNDNSFYVFNEQSKNEYLDMVYDLNDNDESQFNSVLTLTKEFCLKTEEEIDKANQFQDPEAWEYDAEIYYSKKWGVLVRYREDVIIRGSSDIYDYIRLGEAYILNKKYESTIKFLSIIHPRYPEAIDIIHYILDALFAVRKNESDFNWTKKVKIIDLTKEVLNSCYNYLKRKRKMRTVEDVYCDYILATYSTDYLKFCSKDLLTAFKMDKRFNINETEKSLGM